MLTSLSFLLDLPTHTVRLSAFIRHNPTHHRGDDDRLQIESEVGLTAFENMHVDQTNNGVQVCKPPSESIVGVVKSCARVRYTLILLQSILFKKNLQSRKKRSYFKLVQNWADV